MKVILTTLTILVFVIQNLLIGQERKFITFPEANNRTTIFSVHRIQEAHKLSKGKGCRIGILDHSFAYEKHPELYAGGEIFVPDNRTFLTTLEHHGYWMALTLKSVAPDAEIFALNTVSFSDRNRFTDYLSDAVDWAINNKMDVLTYSQAPVEAKSRSAFYNILDKAHKAGIITTFINTGHKGNITPTGLWQEKIEGRLADIHIYHFDYSVIPVDEYFKLKNGERTWWNQPFLSVSSTSPVLGGVIALMKAIEPDLDSKQCKKIITETAFTMDFEGKQIPYVLDAQAAVQEVLIQKNKSK